MKTSSKINTLDKLEKEIYRLKLETKNIEQKLEDNFDYLKDNYRRMAAGSIFGHREEKEKSREGFKSKIIDTIINNEKLNQAAANVVDKVVGKISEEIENLTDKIFHKKE